MIKKMISNFTPFLPLEIIEIIWDNANLNLNGENWSFNTLSSWRILKNNTMICGCCDEKVDEYLNELKNLKITSIKTQNDLSIDPIFILDKDLKIEIFSTDTFEPWTFSIKGLGFYSATPGTPYLFDP